MPNSPKFHIVAALNGQTLFGKRKKWLFAFLPMDKEQLRTFCFHFGLIVLCVSYVFAGAALFYWIEKPFEEARVLYTEEVVAASTAGFIESGVTVLTQSKDDFEAFNASMVDLVDEFTDAMFKLFKDPISANVFDQQFYNCCHLGQWTLESAVLFASTTVIPVGFGLVAPSTPLGRILLVLYAMVGIPIALMVTSDIGKFICGFIFKLLHDSPLWSMLVLMILLLSYPFLMGLIVSILSPMSIIDSVYYSIMCIFTIGYGDIFPPVPTPTLILLIVFGVTLVTVSVELVGSTIIHNVHYMGRQMSRAREIAGRVMKMAQKVNVNRGLSLGISQLGAFTRFGMTMDLNSMAVKNIPIRKETAFEPSIALDFVDFASTSGIFMDDSEAFEEL
uniref:Ion channel n=1 Tax=Panagrellus redivivus TaxID=6233 RepID=A0A7E4URL1_PANRE